MASRRDTTLIIGLVVLALLAAAGWLVAPVLAESPPDAPVDDQLLVAVMRASAVVRSVAQTGEQARPPQPVLLEAVSALSERSALPGWSDLDVLLITALERVQVVESGGDADGSVRARLLGTAEEIDRTIDRLVATSSAQERAKTGFPAAALLAAVSLLVGGACIAALAAAKRTEAVAATGAIPASGVGRVAGDRRGTASPRTEDGPRAGDQDAGAGETPAIAMPTGVCDAAGFERALAAERARCTRYGHDLSAVVLAFDQAEEVARDHGESGMWYVVASIAELALTNTRASDTVAVLADGRVCVLAPETSVEHVELLARKLSHNVELFPFDADIRATVSSSCVDALAESPDQ